MDYFISAWVRRAGFWSLSIALALFLLFAFANYDLDASHWSGWARWIMVILVAIGIGTSFLTSHEVAADERKAIKKAAEEANGRRR